jgi:hypothetical protein
MKTIKSLIFRPQNMLAFLFLAFCVLAIPQVSLADEIGGGITPYTIPGHLVVTGYNSQTGEITVRCDPPYDVKCVTFYIVDGPEPGGPIGSAQYNNTEIELSGYTIITNPDGSTTIIMTIFNE